MKYEFFVNMTPPTVTHQDTRLRSARAVFMAQLTRFRPAEPMKGAVELLTKWCYLGKTKEPKYKTLQKFGGKSK